MKSFALSFTLTMIICAFFMGVFESKTSALINKIPDWFFIVMVVVFFIGYVLALYWGVTGIFKDHRFLNFLGIGFSAIGLSIYLFAFIINGSFGKESPGQFDHALSKIEAKQHDALNDLLQQTNTKLSQVKMVAYWDMTDNPNDFVVCVQHGNIIALQIKNKPIENVANISKLDKLNWLVMENCNLTSIADLKLPFLERLAVNHNRLTSLAGFENEPKVSWLNFRDNPITDSSALQNHPNKELYILN